MNICGKNCVLTFLIILLQTVGSNQLKGTLTFVIDDTGSMYDDIEQVKLRTKQVFEAVMQSNNSVIGNVVLVTFNDPDVAFRVNTTKESEFKAALDSLYADGGGSTCPEMAMTGIALGIDWSNPHSFLYVFTDASALDYEKHDTVQTMALNKSIEVTFLLTGDCSQPNSAGYQVYYRLANVTGGQVFEMEKEEVGMVLDYITESIKSRKCSVSHQHFTTEYKNIFKHPFTVDDEISGLTLSVAGAAPILKVYFSNGTEVATTKLVETANILVLKIENPVADNYTATLEVSGGEADLDIKGACSLSFLHGFSEFRPTSLNGTATNPISGRKVFLFIELNNPNDDVKLHSVQIRDVIGNIIKNVTLRVVNEKEKFYVTDEFVPPEHTFKIAVIGVFTTNNKEVVRVATSAIEPLKIDKENVTQQEITSTTKAYVTPAIQKMALDVEKNGNISIYCTAGGYPKPEMSWKDMHGNTLYESHNFLYKSYNISSMLYTSVIEASGRNDNTFTCTATNAFGDSVDSITYSSPKLPPRIDKTVHEYVTVEGESVNIVCRLIQGEPKPQISWFFMQEPQNGYIQVEVTDEILYIHNVTSNDAGLYKCEARNAAGNDSFEAVVIVDYPPYIEPSEKYVVIETGMLATLDCNAFGSPQPSVRWFFNGTEISSGGRYHIYNNHSIRFKMIATDIGTYKCEVTNRLGKQSSIINVGAHTFVPASIQPPESSEYHLILGNDKTLECKVSGDPPPKVEWSYISFDSSRLTKILKSSDERNNLILKKLEFADAGHYMCIASNSDQRAAIGYAVYVEAEPWIVTNVTSKKITAVMYDAALKLPCVAEGTPSPKVKWLKDGNLITMGDDYLVENNTLYILSITKLSKGTYTCVAENEQGSAIETYDVEVLPVPTLDTPSSELCILRDEHNYIPCNISHALGDKVNWYSLKRKFLLETDTLVLDGRLSDSDTYICRVSNVQVAQNFIVNVSVCFPPIFSSRVSNRREYVKGSYLDCSATGVPEPKVTWYEGEDRLPATTHFLKATAASIYKCEVSNAYGTEKRTFRVIGESCVIKIKDLKKQRPLILKNNFLMPNFHIDEGFIHIPKSETVVLICPNNDIIHKGVNLHATNVSATCQPDSTFTIDKIYSGSLDLNNFKCSELVKPIMTNSLLRCNYLDDHEMIRVGISLGTMYVYLYEVCFNMVKKEPVYSRYRIQNFESRPFPDHDYQGNRYMIDDYDSMYDCDWQRRVISKSIWKDFTSTDVTCFIKRQLMNARDVYPSHEALTFNYINVAPQWSSYSFNWNEIENRVLAKAKTSNRNLIVWTGVYDELKMNTSFGKSKNIQIAAKDNKTRSVSRFLWMIVFDDVIKAAIAIIQLNIPNLLEPEEIQEHVLCQDVCDRIQWLKNPQWRDPTKGYTYCCSLKDFQRAFKHIVYIKGVKRILI